jgi:hypothetical protein
MINPFRIRPPTCPECQSHIRRIHGNCAYCGTDLYIPVAYFRWIWALALAVVVAVAIPTYTGRHAGSWLLGLVCLSLVLRVVAGFLIPPWLERGEPKPHMPFVIWYFACFLFLFCYWTFLGWSHVLVGSTREIGDLNAILSSPIGFISPVFFIVPSQSFADVCGILLGNSFFLSVATLILYRGAHAVIKRNRVTRMNLTGTGAGRDEDDA